MRVLSRFLLLRYSVAALTVGLALPVTWLLSPLEQSPSLLFVGAVMVSAWNGGLGPGLASTALSVFCLDYFFLPPVYSLGVGVADGVRLAAFVLVAVLISSLTAARKRLEQTLRQQDRRKDEFLAILAHELRNFLAPMRNALQVVRLGAADAATVGRAVGMVSRQVDHVARLTDDLMDVARVRQGKVQLAMKPVDLGTAVRQAVEDVRPLIDQRGHRLDVELPAGPVYVRADATRLEQVILNLLTNAAKYTEPGGHIGVSVTMAGGEVCLRVQDTGVGIPPEVLPRLFDLFAQAKGGSHGGLGIGLSLVRSLVDMHGGRVSVTSAGIGRGSEFTVRLPITTAPRQAPEGERFEGPGPADNGRTDPRIDRGATCPAEQV
jgi:two-component system CheB/CheR fusion protein